MSKEVKSNRTGLVKKAVMQAIIACSHEINHDAVVLKFSRQQMGHNAYNQLGLRVEAAIAVALLDTIPSDDGRIATCESCGNGIMEGQTYHTGPDVDFCHDCSPTFADMLANPASFITDGDEHMTPDQAQEIYDKHIAAGGSPDDRMVHHPGTDQQPFPTFDLVERQAASVAAMVTEYVEGGLKGKTDWRNGLETIIFARLKRLEASREFLAEVNDKSHPRFIAGYTAGLNDGRLERQRQPSPNLFGWRPIASAPKDGSDLLLSAASWHGDVVVGCWSFEGWRDRDDTDALEPTHWMPLPAAPNENEPDASEGSK
ncbi:DUF551 domain-containing protein [Rhizobium sp. 18065]|uniref:DUF551 domain-containing protein n=1 Tax=Rhizobium sp. 18065 TaxID=2681411 RepID=UPI00135CC1B1|nr:DUF551 domain-containing protein [Rhizobium sp. 18065]